MLKRACRDEQAQEWRAQDVEQRCLDNARALWRRAIRQNIQHLVCLLAGSVVRLQHGPLPG